MLGEKYSRPTKGQGGMRNAKARQNKDEISRCLLRNQRERKSYIIIYYRSNGKQIEEKAGRQYANDMTAARAAGIRADRSKGKEPSNNTRREQVKAVKLAEAGKMTLERLWNEYEA